jgi:hypothetical protein
MKTAEISVTKQESTSQDFYWMSAAHIVQVGSSMTMRSRIDLMMHSSQGDIKYLLRGIFHYRKSRKE